MLYILRSLSVHTSRNTFWFTFYIYYQGTLHKIGFVLYFMFIIRTHFTKYILFYILCSLSGHTSQNTLCFTFYVHYQVYFTRYIVLYTLCSFIITTLYKTHFVYTRHVHYQFLLQRCFRMRQSLLLESWFDPFFISNLIFQNQVSLFLCILIKAVTQKKLSCKKRKNFFWVYSKDQ